MGQAVFVQPCILTKSVKLVTKMFQLGGYCHSASTHCNMSGRSGEPNADCKAFDGLKSFMQPLYWLGDSDGGTVSHVYPLQWSSRMEPKSALHFWPTIRKQKQWRG